MLLDGGPETGAVKLESSDWGVGFNNFGTAEQFDGLAGAIDGEIDVDGVDEPRKLRSVFDPELHLVFDGAAGVALGADFDDEVRAEGRIACLLLGSEGLPARASEPCGVG